MKRILLTTLLFLSLSLGVGVLAQVDELPFPGLPAEGLPKAGLTPDSPFYFLERISEGIGTFFTFGDLKKAERYAALAAERVAEAEAVVEKGKPEAAQIALKRYEDQLGRALAKAEEGETDKMEEAVKEFEIQHKFGEEISQIAQGLGRDITFVEQLVGKATSIHLEILAEVYAKVPEQAKEAIEEAMEVSAEGHQRAVEALKEKGALDEVSEEVPVPEELPEGVKERIRRPETPRP